MKGRDFALLTDLYELTMMQGYYETGAYNRKVVFDLFYRKNPSGNGFAITAGLQQAIEYLDGLHFTEEDIAYLESLNLFSEDFIDYLRSFRFTGEVYAVPEGTIVFPHEPLMRIKAPIIEAQLIETALLNINQPPEPDCNKGFPRSTRSTGRPRSGIWSAPRAGSRCRYGRCKSGSHRRLCGNKQRADRQAV